MTRQAFRSGRTCARHQSDQPLGGALRLKGIEPVGARPRRLECSLIRLVLIAIVEQVLHLLMQVIGFVLY